MVILREGAASTQVFAECTLDLIRELKAPPSANRLHAAWPRSLPSDQEIDQRSDKWEKEDHCGPDNLHCRLEPAVRQGIDEHPEPKETSNDRQNQGDSAQAKERSRWAV